MAGRNTEGNNPKKQKLKAQMEQKAEKTRPATIRPEAAHNRNLAYLRATGFVSFSLAVGAILMEDYFWWFVALSYTGLAIVVVDCAKEASLGKFRHALIVYFLLVVVGFTFIVWGGVKPKLKAQWTVGNYAEGSDVQGLVWKKGWSDLRVFVVNERDVDLKDVDVEFNVGVPVAAVKQIGELCSIVSEGGITDIVGTDNSTGEQIHFPLGPSRHPYRILCAKIPARTAVEVVVAVTNEDSSDLTKRRPKEVRFHARYKARIRPYDIASSVATSDWGAH